MGCIARQKTIPGHVRKGVITFARMIIFLSGPDTFRSRRQLKQMIEKFNRDRDPQGLNVVRLDAEREQPGRILTEMLSSPFLAERRMIVIENLLVSKHEELMQDIVRRIEERTLPESNVVVFWDAVSAPSEKKKRQPGGSVPKTKVAKELFARLQKEKYAQAFDALSGVKLSAWIASEVKERGGTIDKQAVQYLAQNVGNDMWRLNSLIDQLISHSEEPEPVPSEVEGRNLSKATGDDTTEDSVRQTSVASKDPSAMRLGITVENVQLFLDEKADDNIFNLVDAIVAKQGKLAFAMIQEQYRRGEDAQYIFAMLLRQVRILLELRDLFEREDAAQSHMLAERLGLHPFVVKKSLPIVKRYTMDELRRTYGELLELDVKTKTGQGRPEVLLDVLVGRVCAA